jgi:hypothetical protein
LVKVLLLFETAILVLDFEFFFQQYSCSSDFEAEEVTTGSSYERKMDD